MGETKVEIVTGVTTFAVLYLLYFILSSKVRGFQILVVNIFVRSWVILDRLCGLVVRVLGYRSGGPGSIPGTTRKKM
jgi:hypothetical protein